MTARDERALLCKRCKHPDHWHRHDDANNDPPESAPFRCLGYDCDGEGFPGGTPETRCGCPDFVREGEDARWVQP